jgi:hypothetical protein
MRFPSREIVDKISRFAEDIGGWAEVALKIKTARMQVRRSE